MVPSIRIAGRARALLDVCASVSVSQPWRRCRHCMVTPALRSTLVATGVRLPQGVHLPPSLPFRVRLPIYSLLAVVHGRCGFRTLHVVHVVSRLGVGAWLLQPAPSPNVAEHRTGLFQWSVIVAAWTQA